MKIAFDIGGVLSKYPDIFRPLVERLLLAPAVISVRENGSVDVHVISDMKPHEKAVAYCHDNGFLVPPERIHCADYEADGEACKALLCASLGIDILVDDHGGYVCTPGSPPVRLLVMPDPSRPYYDDDWKTDGSEGNFGRRRNPAGSKRPPENRGCQKPGGWLLCVNCRKPITAGAAVGYQGGSRSHPVHVECEVRIERSANGGV